MTKAGLIKLKTTQSNSVIIKYDFLPLLGLQGPKINFHDALDLKALLNFFHDKREVLVTT